MIRKYIFVLLCAVLYIGCGIQRTTVVLVPDPYGHVGKVSVQTDCCREVLSEQGQAVTLAGEKGSPSPVMIYDEKKIRSIFSDALDAEPPVPLKFILYFQSDSTEFLPDSENIISGVVDSIQQRNSLDISVNGHSDSVGSHEYNLDLSLQRARHVKNLLVEAGIEEKHISMDSHGEGNPLIPSADGVAEPRNRRVEIIVR